MKLDELKAQPLERLLAEALRYGTWIASATIIAGLVLPAIKGYLRHDGASVSMTGLVKFGIALFILLPVMRVVVMLIAFLRDKDYRMGAIAGLVLAIIILGCVMGTMSTFHA